MLSARLILVRHGQSDLQRRGLPPGPGRSAAVRGRARARRERWPPRCRASTNVSSPATCGARRETAALLGYPDARRDPRWREIDVGEWAGPPADRVPVRHRAGLARRPARRARRRDLGRPRGARRRAPSTSCRAGGTWLVVCHGGVVRAALSHVTGADPRRVAGPGERQRDGHPARRSAAARGLRLDAVGSVS